MRNSVSPGVSLFTHALSEFLHVWAGEEEEGEKENFFLFSIWMRRRRPFLSHTLLHAAKRTPLPPPSSLLRSLRTKAALLPPPSPPPPPIPAPMTPYFFPPRPQMGKEGGKSRQQRSSVGRSVKRQKRRRR